ncbi:MAG: MaoC family dehydratase [Caulobacteraceae bacterium]|nr:MaoC family dehydratase [Caulobacter sp.]
MSAAPSGLTREAAQDPAVIGRRAERAHVVTEADIERFAAASGDRNPVHFDEAFARTTPFRGRIAHGMLSAAWISALLAGDLPGPGAVYLGQTLEFKRPIRIGDEVVVSAEVASVDPKGRMVLRTQVHARGKLAVDGEAQALLPAAPRAAA